jgi:class 3 adenylate cyclase
MDGVSRTSADALEAGRQAIERYAWREGYDLLEGADAAAALAPEDLERLAAAAWWTGRLDACISARERAFAGYMTDDKRRRAAMVAMALAKDHYAKQAASIGAAWVARAERLLADEPECVEHGYLERLLSVIAFEGRADFDAALAHARRAREIATKFGDRELQAVALHDQGRVLVAKGEVAEGMALVDEATSAAVSGELSPYNTGVVYCNTITACKELADYRRAGDWTEAAKRWCDRQAISGFPGMCRVYRASVMLVRGAWSEAELEARRACDELMEFNLGYAAEAFYELGELRMRQGDFAAAHEAFEQAHELGRDPQPGVAVLRLAEGKTDGASSSIESALDSESRELYRARLLPAQVEIALANGDRAKALAAAEELTAIAERYGSDAFKAVAGAARSRIALDEGNARLAMRDARAAVRLWQEIGAPFEAAQARMLLASAYVAEGNAEGGLLELRAAATAFERLGAVPDARRARDQLQSLGVGAPSVDAATARETRTLMFTDIVRSTNLVEAIGDDAWAELVRWHDEKLRSVFVEHGGEELDHAGDGFFVAFPTAGAAVECAVAVQRTLFDHRRTHGFAPQVRIGLHETAAVRRGAAFRGKGVHEAARISTIAEGGEILASVETLAGSTIRFPASAPRTVELKGVAEPVELVAIEWRR